MYYIVNQDNGRFATEPRPNYGTALIEKALAFSTWAEASDASQNFGPEWSVEEA